MSTNTSIEWTDATWNPTRGCSRISPGCERCYAERIAGRFSGPGKPYEGLARGRKHDYHGETGQARVGGSFRWTGRVVSAGDETLWAPIGWKKPRRVFVNSMSDLFHEALADEDIEDVFSIMAVCPQHRFQVLTKRAERMRVWCNANNGRDLSLGPEKGPASAHLPLQQVWLGVSVEDQRRADERIPHLLHTPAIVRFLSVEPLLCGVNLLGYLLSGGIHWVIVGGESGPHARPCDVVWIESVVQQCKEASVPVFVKQLGSQWARESKSSGWASPKGGNPCAWPKHLRMREFPLWP